MQYYLFTREVLLLLENHSDEKVELIYNTNPHSFKMPIIGPRPPYYYNPRYEQYYPIL